jgi:hypothetical protein
MPGRMSAGSTRSPSPQPFSSAWLAGATQPEPPRSHAHLRDWLPEGRTLNAALVVLVTVATALFTLVGNRTGPRPSETPIPIPAVAAPANVVDPPRAAPTVAQVSEEPIVVPEVARVVDPTPATTVGAAIGAENQNGESPSLPTSGPLLPNYRIVTFYGHPHDPNMGIVGEYAMEDLATMIRAQAADYTAADPSRPVIPAFELITTVAQRVPGADGTYILDTDHETLKSYIDYAAEHNMLVFLDLQIGRSTVENEIEKVRDLLALPNVHLALDPEFAVAEGEVPGEYIGSVPAESIAYAQNALADISAEAGIPPKVLIVHQFREDMIRDKQTLAPYPGVQLVIDADGYGAPELKTAVYNFLVRDEPIEFAGVKIFFKQDVPLLTAQEILALVPPPDVIIYQ